MIHGAPNNAMAEIALALAMGFFSIMVLTLVSMGGGLTAPAAAPAAIPVADSGADLGRSAPADAGSRESVAREELLIYHRGGFYDGGLAPVDPADFANRDRVVLAVDPSLPLSETLAAREQVPVRTLTLAPLDDRWRRALKESSP